LVDVHHAGARDLRGGDGTCSGTRSATSSTSGTSEAAPRAVGREQHDR
jgi:hypothetical protein